MQSAAELRLLRQRQCLQPAQPIPPRITTAATDVAGNALAGNQAALPAASNYIWSFTTAATPVPPGNISVLSTHTACPNAVNAKFTVPSGLPLNAVSVQTNFVVTAAGSTTPILGSVALDVTNNIATFTPTVDLTPGASYTLTITGGATGVKDTAVTPNTLNMNPYTLAFIPGAATGVCQPPISLGVAAPFGMIGDVTGATNTGTKTVITGDFSSTATVTSAVTGFHDGANTSAGYLYGNGGKYRISNRENLYVYSFHNGPNIRWNECRLMHGRHQCFGCCANGV